MMNLMDKQIYSHCLLHDSPQCIELQTTLLRSEFLHKKHKRKRQDFQKKDQLCCLTCLLPTTIEYQVQKVRVASGGNSVIFGDCTIAESRSTGVSVHASLPFI